MCLIARLLLQPIAKTLLHLSRCLPGPCMLHTRKCNPYILSTCQAAINTLQLLQLAASVKTIRDFGRELGELKASIYL
jgi:hypothetical protein